MAITLNLPGRTRTPAAIEPAPPARVAASAAFQWAGSRVDVESLLRLRADWYPRVQRYARNVGIFGAAARDTAQTIADLEWSPDDKTFGERPARTESPQWARLAECLDTLDWWRAAHQVYTVGCVHIVAWPDPDTMLRLQAYSLSELTPPMSGHPDAAPIVVEFEGAMPRPLWEPGTPPQQRPRIVTAYRPDGEFGRSVWTPAQALLDDFEALLLMSIAAKAYDLNRITGAGILFLPNSLAQLDMIPEGQAKTVMNSPTVRSIIDGFMKPMADPYAPERVVPAIITGPDEAGDRIKQILWERQENPGAFAQARDARWRNIAVALDQPAGRILNSEDQSKFYNSQAIDFFSMRSTVGIARLISDALMRDLFHPILREQWRDKQWRRRTLTPTWDHLQPEPDRTDEALRLLEAGTVTLAHAQDMAKIPEAGRIEVGSPEWRELLKWRAALNPGLGPADPFGGDPLGAAVPPSTGPAAPGTAPDGAGAPEPLAGFDATLASARLAAMTRDLANVRHRAAARTAAGQDHSGSAMVALMLDPEVAKAIAIPAGEDVADLHVTVMYLGKTADLDRASVEAALRTITAEPLSGTIGGIGRFPTSHKEGLQAVWVPVDVPSLSAFHDTVVATLADAGVAEGSVHGYTPHVTLDYLTPEQPSPDPVAQTPVSWSAFTLAWDDEHVEFPFAGAGIYTRTAAAEHPLASKAQSLNDIDRDARTKIAAAAEQAMLAAMRKVGVRIANKVKATPAATATADLAHTPGLIPARLGPSVCAALLDGESDPLANAFDDLADQSDAVLAAAFLLALRTIGVEATSEAGAAAIARAATARTAAVGFLRDQMMDTARTRIFRPDTAEVRGEAVSGMVPAGIPGRAVAVAGGAPIETVDGVTRLAASEVPPAGVATGQIVVDTMASISVEPFTVQYTWIASEAARPFPPHHELHGTSFTASSDARFAVRPGDEWLGTRYSVGDHPGCGCAVTVQFLPVRG